MALRVLPHLSPIMAPGQAAQDTVPGADALRLQIIELDNQRGEAHRYAFPSDRPMVLLVADRKGYEELAPWVTAIRRQAAQWTLVVGVADVRGVPGFLRNELSSLPAPGGVWTESSGSEGWEERTRLGFASGQPEARRAGMGQNRPSPAGTTSWMIYHPRSHQGRSDVVLYAMLDFFVSTGTCAGAVRQRTMVAA